MHEPDKLKCLFGCDADDKLEHYLNCHILWSVLDGVFGGNLSPNLFVRINFDEPSISQCHLIATAFEIYHAFQIGQRNSVDVALSLSGVLRRSLKLLTFLLEIARVKSATSTVKVTVAQLRHPQFPQTSRHKAEQ
jgi:hypothetical protein